MRNNTRHIVESPHFLNDISPAEFEEADAVCVTMEFVDNSDCINHTLFLNFRVARVSDKTTIPQLNLIFNWRSELFVWAKKDVSDMNNKIIEMPGHDDEVDNTSGMPRPGQVVWGDPIDENGRRLERKEKRQVSSSFVSPELSSSANNRTKQLQRQQWRS